MGEREKERQRGRLWEGRRKEKGTTKTVEREGREGGGDGKRWEGELGDGGSRGGSTCGLRVLSEFCWLLFFVTVGVRRVFLV